MGALEAARERLIDPVLVGPEAKIKRAAEAAGIELKGYQIALTEHSHAAAALDVAGTSLTWAHGAVFSMAAF